MRRKKGTEQDAPAVAGARITPEEVQQVEFRLAFRGYNERDVDAFLDRITEDLSAYIADGQASGRGIAGSAAIGVEAEQILAGARAEAEEILERARRDAATTRAASAPPGTVSGDTRAAVAPFLNSEREFLQSLGSLVQTHAEEIRQMVMTLRSRAEATPERLAGRTVPEPPTVREETSSAEQSQTPPVEAAPVSEIRARLEAAGPVPELRLPDAEEAPGEPDDSGPVVVEGGAEAVYTAEGSPAGEQRERSLRELFWGED
jgi:DivIVA domain-containing protein